jgi:hypothetical protein
MFPLRYGRSTSDCSSDSLPCTAILCPRRDIRARACHDRPQPMPALARCETCALSSACDCQGPRNIHGANRDYGDSLITFEKLASPGAKKVRSL